MSPPMSKTPFRTSSLSGLVVLQCAIFTIPSERQQPLFTQPRGNACLENAAQTALNCTFTFTQKRPILSTIVRIAIGYNLHYNVPFKCPIHLN